MLSINIPATEEIRLQINDKKYIVHGDGRVSDGEQFFYLEELFVNNLKLIKEEEIDFSKISVAELTNIKPLITDWNSIGVYTLQDLISENKRRLSDMQNLQDVFTNMRHNRNSKLSNHESYSKDSILAVIANIYRITKQLPLDLHPFRIKHDETFNLTFKQKILEGTGLTASLLKKRYYK